MNRVVITGLGVVSPIGNTVEEFWDSLMAGSTASLLKNGFPVRPKNRT